MYLLIIRKTTSTSVSWSNAPGIWIIQAQQKRMIPFQSQKNRYDLFRPQTSRNDLVCIVTTLQLLLHLLLLAPLCYHLQFPRKHQLPIHLLLNKHRLINCRPGNISAQFNHLFAIVPPAWPKIASNRALKSPNTIACSQITRILSHCWGQSLDRALNFNPFYTIAKFL